MADSFHHPGTFADMLRNVSLSIALATSLSGIAQTNDHVQRTCGAHTFTERHLQSLGLPTDLNGTMPRLEHVQRGGIYTVPVVVHVVWNNAAENVTVGTIQNIIDEMNEDYSASNSDIGSVRSSFTNSIGNVGFQFCLAQVDPSGNATTGITRNQTTDTWFNPDTQTDDMKSAPLGIAPWDTERYLNIWICDITSGASGNTVTVGYAYLPTGGVVGSDIDGLVIDYDYGTQPGARTATHEIGHYFGLQHTFDDGGACVNADGFSDTPTSNSPTFSCSNTNLVKCGVLTQYENFMDYSDCTAMFSDQQAAYMADVLTQVREGLVANQACATTPTGYCIPTSASGPADGDYVNAVLLENIVNVNSGDIAGPAYTNYSATLSATLTRTQPYAVTVQAGTYAPDHFAVWIDYDQDEVFEASEKLGEFATTAADEARTIVFTVPGAAALGNTLMRVRGVYFDANVSDPDPMEPCYAYAFGETEDYGITILAPGTAYCTPTSIAGPTDGDYINGVQLGTIDNPNSGGVEGPAYSDLMATDNTYLTIGTGQILTIEGGEYAPDHYAAWIDYDRDLLFEVGEKLGEFTTTVAGETGTIPFTVPANAPLGDTRMRVRGVFVGVVDPIPVDPCYSYAYGETEDYGITIETTTGLREQGVLSARTYPNPTTGMAVVELADPSLALIRLIDPQGRSVSEQQGTGGRIILDLSTVASGTYYVRIQQGEYSTTQRLEVIAEAR